MWLAIFVRFLRVSVRETGIYAFVEDGFTNKPGMEKFIMLGNQAMHRIGLGFSPSGKTQGLVSMLKYLLRQAGLQDVTSKSYILDTSYGEPAHAAFVQNCQILFVLAQPFYVNMQVATAEEIDALAEQALAEMQEADYCGISFLLTATGIKPD